MRNGIALLLGSLVAYMSQNMAASNGNTAVLPFIALGLIVTFVVFILIGHSHGQQR